MSQVSRCSIWVLKTAPLTEIQRAQKVMLNWEGLSERQYSANIKCSKNAVNTAVV